MTAPAQIEIGLNAAIVAISARTPRLLVVGEDGDALDALPFGPFDPNRHRTMEMSLRHTVEAQTALELGYIEQLYTFGDRGRHKMPGDQGPHVVSVGYLALTRLDSDRDARLELSGARWRDWYGYLPWEDWRQGRPALLDGAMLPALRAWAEEAPAAVSRRSRLKLAFGLDDFPFDEERVLERYELLYEAGLVEEAVLDGRAQIRRTSTLLGRPMRHDHRRIAATALARLRSKIKYRPVIFELMPPDGMCTSRIFDGSSKVPSSSSRPARPCQRREDVRPPSSGFAARFSKNVRRLASGLVGEAVVDLVPSCPI